MYRKDDCGKLTNKDSNHTRRSKQNTYHVVNKNIAPSKLSMVEDERGDAFRGIPKIWLFGVLGFTLGCLGHPQAQALATPCSIIHQIFYPKLENFTTQNLTENLVSSVSERKQNTTSWYCIQIIIFILVLSLLYSNFSMVYKPFYQSQIQQNKQTTHEKQNLSKTEQSVVICIQRKIWNPKNSKTISGRAEFIY